MGIVCGRDRFGRTYAYQVPDIKGTAGVGGGPRTSTFTGAGGVVGPLPGREAAVTLQIYLVTDQNFKVPHPTGETTGAGESAATGVETSDSGLKDPDAPCPGSDGSSSTERGKASNGQEQNGSRADGSDDDESTRSDTSATLPKPILRFLEWLFSGPL